MPWGGAGDLGQGINMGIAAGAAAQRMHEGFAVAPIAASCATTTIRPTSTCLFADAPQEQAGDDATGASDILNSPAFLKRKIDVLKSDIAKAEEDIELAKQRMEEGKAEWGGQLDELQKEVSVLLSRNAWKVSFLQQFYVLDLVCWLHFSDVRVFFFQNRCSMKTFRHA